MLGYGTELIIGRCEPKPEVESLILAWPCRSVGLRP